MQVCSRNGILTGSAIFAGLTRVTDQQTEKQMIDKHSMLHQDM